MSLRGTINDFRTSLSGSCYGKLWGCMSAVIAFTAEGVAVRGKAREGFPYLSPWTPELSYDDVWGLA
jgi:hypothetical protein